SKRNFGMAYPEGYRKSMRVMELADRHGFPLITLVDTPGAYPGVAAEQHGQGGMIARSQAVMARLRSPIVSCIIGEGGSGGAIAIAVADRVLMQQNAIYSVISPEGCAAILWRDAGEAQKAAAAFKPDAVHCLELGVIDGIVPEPAGGAQEDYDEAARLLDSALLVALADLEGASGTELRRLRRAQFRGLGGYACTSRDRQFRRCTIAGALRRGRAPSGVASGRRARSSGWPVGKPVPRSISSATSSSSSPPAIERLSIVACR